MKKYTLDVEEDLWRAFKSKCGALGLTLKQALVMAIEAWIKREGGER